MDGLWISLRGRSMTERFGLSQLVYVCHLNVSHQFGREGVWVLGTVREEKGATGP